MENTSGMEKIIKTCAGGKSRVAKKKIVSSMIITFVAALINYLPDLLLTQKIHGLKNLNVTLHSLGQFTAINADIKIWQYLLILFGIRLLGAAIAVMIIHYISDKTNLQLISVVIATAVLALPPLLRLFGINIFDMFSLTPLLAGNMIFLSFSYKIIISVIAYAIIAAVFASKLMQKRCRH